MKLFENGVGRPSNEIKKKRRIFIVGIVTLCAMLIITLSFVLTNINTKKLKGSMYNQKGLKYLKLNGYSLSVSDSCDLLIQLGLEDTKKAGINVGQLSLMEKKGAYFLASSNRYAGKVTNNQFIINDYKFDKATIQKALNDSENGKRLTFMLEFSNYKSESKIEPKNFIFYIELDDGMIKNIKACKRTTLRKINLNCPSKGNIDEQFSCFVKGYEEDVANVKFTVGGANSLASGYQSTIIPDLIGSNIRNMQGVIDIKYTDKLFTNYAKYIQIDSDGYEFINAKITASKTGYQTVTETVKIYKESNRPTSSRKNISLTCDTTSEVNKEFSCKTNVKNVKITAGGAKSLAKDYKSTFTSGVLDKKFKLKYDSKLFTNYKSQIKKDSKGEYISVKVTAVAKGYKSTTKYVKIYNTKKAITATKKKTTGTIALSCPSSAKVNEAFKCKTDQSGVTITLGGANSLASGYSSKYTTTSSDKTKSIKYTSALFTNYKNIIKKDSNGKEYINAQVTAKKSGYKTITKNVKIYRNTSSGAAAKPITPGVSESIKTTTVKTTVDKYSLSGIWFYYEITGGNKTKTIKIKPTKYGSNVKNDSYVMCETYSDCTNNNAWTNMNNKYKGTQNPTTNRNIARVNKTESVWINTNYKGIAGKKYYLRVTTYSSDNASNWIYVGVFEIAVDSKNNVKATEVYSKFK